MIDDVDINNVGNNDFLGLIDDFGLPGNWLIRANATGGGGGGEITLTASVQGRHGGIKVRLEWSPADGGDINVLRDGGRDRDDRR